MSFVVFLFLMFGVSVFAETPACYPITVDSQLSTVAPLISYQAEQRCFTATFVDNTNASDVSAASPIYMVLASNLQSASFITSSWSFVNSGTGGQVKFTFSASSMNITGDWKYLIGAGSTYRHGDIRIYANPYATGVPAPTFSSNQNLAGYTFLNAPWIEDITISSGAVWSITDTGTSRILTVNTNSGFDGGITNINSNTSGLTFTNNGRQAYATASFATGTPIYVETGISNNVIQGQTNLLSSTNSGRQAFLTLNGVVASGAVDSITSAMIVDGTIVNADISSSAAIAATKIANTGLTQATTFTGDVAGVWSALTLVNGSVTWAKILDGTITNDDINANAAIAATKIAGTAATTAQLYSAVLNDAQYINALLRDGSRSFTSNQNAGGFSITNGVRFAGTNGAINMSTRAADSTTVWTDFNADLLDGFNSTVFITNAIIQGQTGLLSASNNGRSVYLTLTGAATQVDFAGITNGVLTNVLLRTNNGSDIPDKTAFRTNLLLLSAATNAFTNPVFNASQLMDFSVSGTDPTANQILQLSSSVWTPYSVGGDATLVTGNLQIAAAAITITEVDTNSLSTVFATDTELNNASNALRTTANVLATNVIDDYRYPNAVLRDGSRSMTGNLNMAQNAITNVLEIGRFAGNNRYFNFEDGDSDTNEWTALNVGFIQGYRASNLVKTTTSQRMTGPLVVTDSVLIHTNLHLAATNSLGSELLVNGTFAATNGDGTVTAWTLTSASYDSGQKIYVAPGATATIAYSNASPLTAYKSYQVSFLADIDTGTNPTTFRVTLGGYTQTYANISDGTFTFQGRLENTNNISFAITPGTNTFFLDTVSIKEITQGDAWFADDVTVGGALRVAENAVFASNVTAASFTGVFGGSSTSFVEIAGDTMLGGLTNNSGFYGNGIGITNLPAGSSSAFVLKAGDTMTGALTISNSAPAAYWRDNDGTNAIVIGVSGTYGPFISLVNNYPNAAPMLAIDGNTNLQRRLSAATAFTVMDSGNDGSGSGFDADLLDGLSSAAFLTNNIILSNSTVVGSASIFNFVNPSALTIAGGTANVTMATGSSGSGTITNSIYGGDALTMWGRAGNTGVANKTNAFGTRGYTAFDSQNSETTAVQTVVIPENLTNFNFRVQYYADTATWTGKVFFGYRSGGQLGFTETTNPATWTGAGLITQWQENVYTFTNSDMAGKAVDCYWGFVGTNVFGSRTSDTWVANAWLEAWKSP